MRRLCILMFILVVTFSGCAWFRTSTIKLSESDIKNVEAMEKAAVNFLRTWPFYSGIIKCGLGRNLDYLPKLGEGVARLDELATRLEEEEALKREDLGCSLVTRVTMLSDLVQEGLKLYAPDLLSYIPAFLGF